MRKAGRRGRGDAGAGRRGRGDAESREAVF